ncbi:hypothetical protein SADUNF_Sadunf08G0009800 [Salix dunnii]|uniref:Uncharacterized protein n=1 Tax=Salix dunnii TaxID=1413687 RepID=A0A835JZC8_9ROSI|nr:hypothetical protein SADUNF_Sadunf08G0009800 [Salix dunnii]
MLTEKRREKQQVDRRDRACNELAGDEDEEADNAAVVFPKLIIITLHVSHHCLCCARHEMPSIFSHSN